MVVSRFLSVEQDSRFPKIDEIIFSQGTLYDPYAVHIGTINAAEILDIVLVVVEKDPGMSSGDILGWEPEPASRTPADNDFPLPELDYFIVFTTANDFQKGLLFDWDFTE